MMEPGTVARLLRLTVPSIGRAVDDPEALAQALQVRDALDREIAAAALRLHQRDGYSFTDLGRVTGTTRQTAQQRWTATWRRLGLTARGPA